MDLVLIHLISVGFAKLSEGLTAGRVVSDGVSFDGDHVVRALVAVAPTETNAFISRTVADIWSGCQAVGLPAEIAEPHLVALTDVIKVADITFEDCEAIVTGGSGPEGAAAAVSDRMMAAAPAIGAEIDETVLGYLATTLFKSFAASGDLLVELSAKMYPAVGDATTEEDAETGLKGGAAHIADSGLPAVAEAAPLPAAPVSNAALTLAKIERADALGISVPLLETLTVCLINRTKSAEIRYDDLVAGAKHAQEIQVALMRLQQQPGAGVRDFETSIGHFVGGRFAECDRALAAIEERSVERTIAPVPDSAVTELALAIRLVRAELSILQGVYQKAARHFGFAQRYVPRSHADTRWPLAEREAHYYEVTAYQGKAPSNLDQAARACTSAIATMPDEQPSVMMAMAQTVLARLLTLIGERDQAAERFEIAAQLLASAQQTFADSSYSSDEAIVAALRAGALTRLGELINKPDLLEQAAWIVQSALELAAEDRENLLPEVLSEDAGCDLELQLALAVAGFAVRTESAGLLETAVSTLKAKLPSLLEHRLASHESGYSRKLLAARCHHAMAAWRRMAGDGEGVERCREHAASAYTAAGFKDLAETARLVGSVTPYRGATADAA